MAGNVAELAGHPFKLGNGPFQFGLTSRGIPGLASQGLGLSPSALGRFGELPNLGGELPAGRIVGRLGIGNGPGVFPRLRESR